MPTTAMDNTAADTVMQRILGAAEWLSRARVALAEPNGDAAAAAFLQHTRQRLLEAVALIDARPTARRELIALPALRKERT